MSSAVEWKRQISPSVAGVQPETSEFASNAVLSFCASALVPSMMPSVTILYGYPPTLVLISAVV